MTGKLAHLDAERAERAAKSAADLEKWAHEQPLECARAVLGLPTLKRVVKRSKSDAHYDLEVQDGTLLAVGSIDALRNPRKVESVVWDYTGVVAKLPSPAKFLPVLGALLAIAELEDSGATPESTTRAWLGEYLHGRAVDADPATAEGKRRMVGQERHEHPLDIVSAPGGITYLYLPVFESWLRNKRIPTTTADLSARLARLGFERTQIEAPRTTNEKRGRRWYWRSPADFDPEDEE